MRRSNANGGVKLPRRRDAEPEWSKTADSQKKMDDWEKVSKQT